MKHTMKVILFVLTLMGVSFGSDLIQHPAAGEKSLNNEGQVVLQTIQKLESLGYITGKSATEAKKELVFNNDSLQVQEPITKENSGIKFKDYLSFTNVIKLLAVLAFLVAFRGIIVKFIYLFKKVPVWIYQIAILSSTLYLTFYPESVWESEAFYIRNFGVIANLLVVGWIYGEYRDFFDRVMKYISLNVPPKIVISAYVMVYFGYFAIMAESQFLGIFALIGFVSIFGFFVSGDGMTTYIGYDDSEVYMNVSMFVNGLLIAAYSYLVINGVTVPYLEVFSVGIEYVSTLAFVIALVINASFWSMERPIFGLSLVLILAAFIASLFGGMLYNLEVIPAIINTGFFIFMLGWVGYLSHKMGGILMAFIVGMYLYGFALLLESKPELFVTSLF